MGTSARTTRPIQWAIERVYKICFALQIAPADFFGQGRLGPLVEAREIAVYLLREYPGPGNTIVSFPEIASSMARGNHSTVISAYARAKKKPVLLEKADALADLLGLKRRTPLVAPEAGERPATGRTDAA